MKPYKLFWLALYFIIPTLLIGLIFSSPISSFGDPLYNLSVVSGACAFVWLVNQLVLSARPKFIERHFGMDRLYRFHAWMAVVSLGLVIAAAPGDCPGGACRPSFADVPEGQGDRLPATNHELPAFSFHLSPKIISN